MNYLVRGAASGVLAGIVSGTVFSILICVAMHAMLSISANLGIVAFWAIIGGAACGLSCGLLYAYTCQKFSIRSHLEAAVAIAGAFSFPWGFSWLAVLLPSLSIDQNSYTVFLHKLGVEMPWIQIPTSSHLLVDLMDISSVCGYFLVFLLLVLFWTLMFALVIVRLWNRAKTD